MDSHVRVMQDGSWVSETLVRGLIFLSFDELSNDTSEVAGKRAAVHTNSCSYFHTEV